MGGNQAAAEADWSPFAGRHVTIWPDHDAPGSNYAEDVARLVAPIAASVRIVQVPEHFPAKWDLADQVPHGTPRQYMHDAISGGAGDDGMVQRFGALAWAGDSTL
jgi:hypothetical protein